MHIQPIINSVQAALLNHSSLATSDPAIESAINQLVEVLGPALRVAAVEMAEQAAGEVRAQLPEHSVDVVLSDGDPTIRLTEAQSTTTDRALSDDAGARITLRLSPTLKQLVEDAAEVTGESVNAWVIEALGKRARRNRGSGNSNFNQSFDL